MSKQSTVLFSCLIAIALLSLAVLGSHSVLGQTTDFQTELLNYAGQEAIAHSALLFVILGAAVAFAVGFKKLPRSGGWACWGYYLVLSGLLTAAVRTIFGLIFWAAIANAALYYPCPASTALYYPCPTSADCQMFTGYWYYILSKNDFVHEWFAGGLWSSLYGFRFPNLGNKGLRLAIGLGFIAGFFITKMAKLTSSRNTD